MHVRLLTPWDRDAIRDHFLALGPEGRRLRFFAGVGDDFIRDYTAGIDWLRTRAVGAFEGRDLIGVAELVRLPAPALGEAEIALTVAPDRRGEGVGADLLRHALALARNRFIATVYLLCLPENLPMRRLAAKFGATLSTDADAIRGRIHAPWPGVASLIEEAAAGGQTVLQAAFDLALTRRDAA